MQTYGLKVGDKVKLSQNAGTHPTGYVSEDLFRKEPIAVKAWSGSFIIDGFKFIDGATYISLIGAGYLIATEVELDKKETSETLCKFKVGDKVRFLPDNMETSFYSAAKVYSRRLKENPNDIFTVSAVGSNGIPSWSYMFIMVREDSRGSWHPVDCFELVKDKDITMVAEGDYVTILKGTSNWNKDMDVFIGRTVEVTKVRRTGFHNIVIEFEGYDKWIWETKSKHFRYATPEEIMAYKSGIKIIKFDSIVFTLVKGSKVATSDRGNVTVKDIEKAFGCLLPSVNVDILGYSPKISVSLDTIVAFGCQKDSLEKVIEIYNFIK